MGSAAYSDTYLRRSNLSLDSQPSDLNFSYGYDAASRLPSVNEGNNNIATYSYLANSPLVSNAVFTSWTEGILRAKRKGDPGKVALARELRSRTTVPLTWIAGRLWIGRRGYLAWLLSRRNGDAPSSATRQTTLHL
jgi:hypothetical protein